LKIRVDCYAGHRGEEEPRAFTLGEKRFAVVEILDRWLDPARRYFKVKADDRRRFILRHKSASGEHEPAHAGAARALRLRPSKNHSWEQARRSSGRYPAVATVGRWLAPSLQQAAMHALCHGPLPTVGCGP
jgi:hypothetical protein